MTTPQSTTSVNPDDLDALGQQFGAAADTLQTAIGDGTQLTSTPPDAFGPATDVVQNYMTLAADFVSLTNVQVAGLRRSGQSLRDSAAGYRQIEAANQQRITSAARSHR